MRKATVTNREMNFHYDYIAIEGNIGVGKTSLATRIAAEFNARLILEQFEENAFLPKFYENPAKYAFPLELTFLAERYQQLKDQLSTQDMFKTFTIADYFIYKSLIFAGRNLEGDELTLYTRLFNIIEAVLPKPDLLVYLYLDIENLKTGPGNSTSFTHIWYSSFYPKSVNYPYPDGPITFRLRISSSSKRLVNSIAVTIYDQYGSKLVNLDTISLGIQTQLDIGVNEIELSVDQLHLNPGVYNIGLWMANYPAEIYYKVDQVMKLDVVDIEQEKFGLRPKSDGLVTNVFKIKKK